MEIAWYLTHIVESPWSTSDEPRGLTLRGHGNWVNLPIGGGSENAFIQAALLTEVALSARL